MKRLMLTVLAAIAAMNLFGTSIEVVDGVTWYYETYSRKNITEARILQGGDRYFGNLTVPSALGGFPVTAIGGNAFDNCSELTGIILHEGIWFIECRLNVRLEEVNRRLRTTSDPIGQIAVDCGWRNPASLKNLFKRLYGVSMRDWR